MPVKTSTFLLSVSGIIITVIRSRRLWQTNTKEMVKTITTFTIVQNNIKIKKQRNIFSLNNSYLNIENRETLKVPRYWKQAGVVK